MVGKCKQKLAWIFLGKRLLLSEKYSLKCPRCGSKLKKINKEITSIEHVAIDVCPNCQGMWLDDGEIEKLVSLSKGENKQKSKKVVKKKTLSKLKTKKKKIIKKSKK